MSAEAHSRTARPGHRLRITRRRPPQARTAEHRAIRDDVRRSKAALEDVLGEAVRHFCYPTAVMTAAPSTRRRRRLRLRHHLRAFARHPGRRSMTLPRKAISWGDNLLGYFWRLHMKNTPRPEPIRRSGETFADALTCA